MCILSKSPSIDVKEVREMNCFNEAWQDWLTTEHKYAIGDRPKIIDPL